MSSSLLTIIAHARSGALDHAWRLFREAGLEANDADPTVLSLRGRLLKDRALAAAGNKRRELYRQAADAYGRAGAISGATYPLINAATLALLAGDAGQAARRARDVLARLEAGEGEPDTPYYLAATGAEALLLLGEAAPARAALGEAMVLAPRAWEDHASTLQQFARILSVQDADPAWLDPLRPPRSLHFGGHTALAPRDPAATAAVAATLEAERVGFGFGSLAAGADIVIAEALLARDAELHLVLSAPPTAFRATSAAAQGGDWAARFDAVLARAATVRWLGHPDDPPHPFGVQLAAETAMGQAILQARALASEAVQLVILDPDDVAVGDAGGGAWMAAAWRAAGPRQHVLAAPRAGETAALAAAPPATPIAMLQVELDGPGDSLAAASRLARSILPVLGAAIDEGPATIAPADWRGASVRLAYTTPGQAAAAALAIAAALRDATGFRIAGDYGLAPLDDGGQVLLLGRAAALPAEILRSVPPGAIHVTETFACAVQVSPERGRPPAEYVGDLPGGTVEAPVRLFALRAAPAG